MLFAVKFVVSLIIFVNACSSDSDNKLIFVEGLGTRLLLDTLTSFKPMT